MEQVVGAIDRAIGHYMVDEGITRLQMAQRLGMSANTLRWKREGKNEWTLSEIVKLSALIGKSPDELLGMQVIPV